MKRGASGLVLTALLASCSGGDGLVDIGTHSLHMDRAGEGSPTVVVDVGIGGRFEEWALIQERVSQSTTMVLYDRAGYGRSEPGPFPRDASRAAKELHALLKAASIPAPYLLVGHSLGGLHMQIFANRYPDEVAGMVLLDPPPLGWIRGESYTDLLEMADGMTAEWQAIADSGGDNADFFRTIASEHREMLGASGEQAAAIESFGDLPLIVIAAGVPNPMFGDIAEEYQLYWIEQSRLLAAKSSRGELVIARDSTHMLHVEAEELVVESILGMISSEPGEAVAVQEGGEVHDSLQMRIPPPAGFERLEPEPGSFGAWLRQLPVKPGRPPVLLYNGRPKSFQNAHHAVLDIDVGDEDLQQCADAVIRLRAEYLLTTECSDEIHFNFTSGDTASWKEWRAGVRPLVSGNDVSWSRSAAADDSYENFRRYLDVVFMYAGSASLERELHRVDDPSTPRPGDIFIQGGFPGHAVIVVDVARNAAGETIFLLAQSYMPAQEIHVLSSFEEINPWYRAHGAGDLRTPEWDFEYGDLMRFEPASCEARRGR